MAAKGALAEQPHAPASSELPAQSSETPAAVPADLVPEGGLPQLPPVPSDLEPPVRVSDEQLRQYEEFGYTLLPECDSTAPCRSIVARGR